MLKLEKPRCSNNQWFEEPPGAFFRGPGPEQPEKTRKDKKTEKNKQNRNNPEKNRKKQEREKQTN